MRYNRAATSETEADGKRGRDEEEVEGGRELLVSQTVRKRLTPRIKWYRNETIVEQMPGHKTTASSFPFPIADSIHPRRASQLAFLLMGQDKLRPRRSVFSVSACRGCPQNFFQYPFTSRLLPLTLPSTPLVFLSLFFFFLSGSCFAYAAATTGH